MRLKQPSACFGAHRGKSISPRTPIHGIINDRECICIIIVRKEAFRCATEMFNLKYLAHHVLQEFVIVIVIDEKL